MTDRHRLRAGQPHTAQGPAGAQGAPAVPAVPAVPAAPAVPAVPAAPADGPGRAVAHPTTTDRRSGSAQPPAALDAVPFDETDIGWGELPEPSGRDDERILREVPPHHL